MKLILEIFTCILHVKTCSLRIKGHSVIRINQTLHSAPSRLWYTVSQDEINNAQKGNIWHWTLCDRASLAYTPLITCTMVLKDMKSVKLCHSLALGFINISTNFDDSVISLRSELVILTSRWYVSPNGYIVSRNKVFWSEWK